MHYSVAVLLNDFPGADPRQLEAAVEPALERFSYDYPRATLEQTACPCVRLRLHRLADQEATRVEPAPAMNGRKPRDLRWRVAWAERQHDLRVQILRSFPAAWRRGESGCSDCGGSGQILEPEGGYWDWWEVGGRWSGEPRRLRHPERPASPHPNLQRLADTSAEYQPYAWVVPAGQGWRWEERGESYHWPAVHTRAEWQARERKLRLRFADHWLVQVDCHR